MVELFITLFVAHLLSDFYLQSDDLCKMRKPFWGGGIMVHVFLTFITAFALLTITFGGVTFKLFWLAISLALAHYLIDSIKAFLILPDNLKDNSKKCRNRVISRIGKIIDSVWRKMYIQDKVVQQAVQRDGKRLSRLLIHVFDQMAHLAVIIGIVCWDKAQGWWIPTETVCMVFDSGYFWAALAMLISAKPANIFIRWVLEYIDVKPNKDNKPDSTNHRHIRALAYCHLYFHRRGRCDWLIGGRQIHYSFS